MGTMSDILKKLLPTAPIGEITDKEEEAGENILESIPKSQQEIEYKNTSSHNN